MSSYEQFLADLAVRESSGRYDIVNKLGYLGKYQMGESALMDAGYYQSDKKNDNHYSDRYWTGKDGVHSKTDFLKSPQAQENAIREYMKVQWQYLLHDNVDRFIGQTRFGILITISGALAGAHLVGWSCVGSFVKQGKISFDRNIPKVPITEYIQKFAGYDTPFKLRKKLTGIQKNKQRKTEAYQIDGHIRLR